MSDLEFRARKYGRWLALACFVAFVVGQFFAISGWLQATQALEEGQRNRAERIQQLEDAHHRIRASQQESCARGNDIRRALRAALDVPISRTPGLSPAQVEFYREAYRQAAPVDCRAVTP